MVGCLVSAIFLKVSVGNRLGIEEPQLMKIIRATLHSHTEWFKLQMCKDRFSNLLKIDSLKEVNTDLIGAIKSSSNKENNTNLSSQLTTTSSSTMTSEDGGSSSLMMTAQTSSREALWEESAILKVMVRFFKILIDLWKNVFHYYLISDTQTHERDGFRNFWRCRGLMQYNYYHNTMETLRLWSSNSLAKPNSAKVLLNLHEIICLFFLHLVYVHYLTQIHLWKKRNKC